MEFNEFNDLVTLKLSVGDDDFFMELLDAKEPRADMNMDQEWLKSLPFEDPPLNHANNVPGDKVAEQADKAVALMAGVDMDDQTKDKLWQKVIDNGGHLFPNDLSPPPRNEQELYDDSLRTGRKVFRAIEASLSPPNAADKKVSDMKKEMNKIFYDKLYKKVAKTRLTGPDDKEQEYITISGKFGSKFKQIFDTKEGRIVAENTYQKQYGHRDPLSWSDIAFYYFKDQIEQDHGEVSSLKEIEREGISNRQTLTTMARCYADRGEPGTKVLDWTPANGDSFYALLGTPNGRGAGWLLADHNDEMGYLQIVSIKTEIRGKDDGYMWVQYGQAARH